LKEGDAVASLARLESDKRKVKREA